MFAGVKKKNKLTSATKTFVDKYKKNTLKLYAEHNSQKNGALRIMVA